MGVLSPNGTVNTPEPDGQCLGLPEEPLRPSPPSHEGPRLGQPTPQAQALLTGVDTRRLRMKPEPRPHRASDNGARGLLRASPTPTGQVPCCGLPLPGPATEPGGEAQATASAGVCSGRSSCPTDHTARPDSQVPRTGAAQDLKVPCCRLAHTPAWTQSAEPWAGDMAWLGCRQWGRGCGLEGQEFLPCFPGHVQNSDAHTEALRVVPGPSSGGAGPLAGREGSGVARTLGRPSVYRP